MTIQRYKDTHEGRTPAQDGVKTLPLFIEGKVQDAVLFRKKPAGEFDVVFSDEIAATLTEDVDDGRNILRAGQVGSKFQHLAASIRQNNELDNVLQTLAEDQAKQKKLEAPSQDPSDGTLTDPDDGSSSDHESVLLQSSQESNDILSRLTKPVPKGKAKQKAPSSRTRSSASTLTKRRRTKSQGREQHVGHRVLVLLAGRHQLGHLHLGSLTWTETVMSMRMSIAASMARTCLMRA